MPLQPADSTLTLAALASASEQGAALWNVILSNALGLTVAIILISAVIGTIIRYRRKDRVLKDFDRYSVVVVLADGRRIWGVLRVFPNGLEVQYVEPVNDPSGHIERSFVLHQAELTAIRAILRPKDALTPSMLRRRRADIQRYVRPSIIRRCGRFLMIQFSLLRDALVQTFTVVVGHARGVATPTSRMGTVLQSQDRHITELGRTVISSVNLAYDPILESFFGQGCVVEVPENGEYREIPGVLKEYSPEWLELLRASWPVRETFHIPEGEPTAVSAKWNLELRRADGRVLLVNKEERNVELLTVQVDGEMEERTLECQEILPGGEWVCVENIDNKAVTVEFILLQAGDLIVPRSSSLVRHRLKQEPSRVSANLGIGR